MYKTEVEGLNNITAKIVEDSTCNDTRITTFELQYPRFIHSEFMTHRVFARNASSSRAIPTKKMLDQVRYNPATPVHWGLNQPGMQASQEIAQRTNAILLWRAAATTAASFAHSMAEMEIHKQVTNRVLEPFQLMRTIVTATEWTNWYQLRNHEDADPNIRELAKCMNEAQASNTPVEVPEHTWHLPYVVGDEREHENAKAISAARCARVSFLNHDNTKPDLTKELELAKKLAQKKHMSPFEHAAVSMPLHAPWPEGATHQTKDGTYWSGPFKRWSQLRHLM